MIGYRFWDVIDGHLVSPYQHKRLDLSGTIRAHCAQHPHAAPNFSCVCGVAYYDSKANMLAAADALNLWHDDVAFTTGTVGGALIADRAYTVAVGSGLGWRWAQVPEAYRCTTYEVATIYANTTNLVYSLPILPKSTLQ